MDEKVRHMEFDVGDDKNGECKVEVIRDSAIFAKESESGHLSGFYYLVSWKRYPKEENTWELALAVQHFRKLINLFHKDHPDKPTITSHAIDTVPPMARPTIKPTGLSKQKRGRLASSTNKQTKTNWAAFEFYCFFGQIWVTPMFDILSRNTRDCTWLYVIAYNWTWLYVISILRSSKLLLKSWLLRLFKPQS